jgi:hypothetical protein
MEDRLVRKPDRPALKSRFSPDFRAAVSLGLIKLALKRVDDKRSDWEPVQMFAPAGGQAC